MKNVLRISITDQSQVYEARWFAAKAAAELGFNDTDKGRVSIIVTELAGNLIKHASKDREFQLFSIRKTDGSTALEMLAIDKGPGIKNVTESMRDGFSTAGSPGTGLGSVNRLSDCFDIYSELNKGTVIYSSVISKKHGSIPAYSGYSISGINLPKPGEEVSGDMWDYKINSGKLRIIVSDGLGHGTEALRASMEATKRFAVSRDSTLEQMMESLHSSMRQTRGAAVALTEVDPKNQVVRYCGIGNISATLISSGSTKSLVSYNGIVGYEMNKLRTFDYEWTDDSLLILHSDGLGTRWNIQNYPGLIMKSPMVICAVLYRDYVRGNDDVTVVALRKSKEAESG